VRVSGVPGSREQRGPSGGTIEHVLSAGHVHGAFLVCLMDAYARPRLAAHPAFLVADLGIQVLDSGIDYG